MHPAQLRDRVAALLDFAHERLPRILLRATAPLPVDAVDLAVAFPCDVLFRRPGFEALDGGIIGVRDASFPNGAAEQRLHGEPSEHQQGDLDEQRHIVANRRDQENVTAKPVHEDAGENQEVVALHPAQQMEPVARIERLQRAIFRHLDGGDRRQQANRNQSDDRAQDVAKPVLGPVVDREEHASDEQQDAGLRLRDRIQHFDFEHGRFRAVPRDVLHHEQPVSEEPGQHDERERSTEVEPDLDRHRHQDAREGDEENG